MQILLLWLWLGGCSAPTLTPTPDPDAIPAHEFALERLSGGTLALADLRGRWVIVNFWATWCLPCREEMPYLQDLAQRFPDQLTVIGVNQREEAVAVRDFIEEMGIDFPILLDPDDETLLAYQVMGLPRTAVIDPHGGLDALFLGRVDQNPTFQSWRTAHFPPATDQSTAAP